MCMNTPFLLVSLLCSLSHGRSFIIVVWFLPCRNGWRMNGMRSMRACMIVIREFGVYTLNSCQLVRCIHREICLHHGIKPWGNKVDTCWESVFFTPYSVLCNIYPTSALFHACIWFWSRQPPRRLSLYGTAPCAAFRRFGIHSHATKHMHIRIW